MELQERFNAWLAGAPDEPFSYQASNGHHTVIRVRKSADFDYLYFQRNYNADSIERGDSFQYAGIYCRRDGLVYDRKPGIEALVDTGRGVTRLYDRLEADVCGAVEAAIGGDRENLRVTALASRSEAEGLESFIRHSAATTARKIYLDGGSGEFPFRCGYGSAQWTETSLLEYILNPEGYAAREAASYLETHQETMLRSFLENDALEAEYRAIAKNPRHQARRVKAILEAMRGTAAKTVRVTIRKDGAALTFKAEADQFRRDCRNSYSAWRIEATGRREFERLFGHGDYGPENILRIEYNRAVIYEAEVTA